MPTNNIVKDIDQYSINIAKALIMDTVRNANSGHTGGPFSSLDFTYILFKDFLKYDYENPNASYQIYPYEGSGAGKKKIKRVRDGVTKTFD